MITSKIKLPEVTLVAMTGKDIPEHIEVLKKSMEGIEFGNVKLIYPTENKGRSVSWDVGCENIIHHEYIEPINSIEDWNRRIILDLPKYVETTHALLIHPDGYVIHPELWKDEWLDLDYIGSPWPLPLDDYSYRDEWGQIVRVGNGVSLRSKKLMDLAATRPMVYHYNNNNEDGQICCWNRQWLILQGCKFATFEQALEFGKEVELPENKDKQTFVFHSI